MIGIRDDEINAVYAELGLKAEAGTALCQQYIKSCPGNTYCNRGQRDTLGLARRLSERFHPFPKITAKVKIGISGCFNSCSEPAIKDIGLIGLPKGWVLMVGGAGGKEPMIAQTIARDLGDDQVLDVTGKILTYYRGLASRPQTRNLRLGVILQKEGTARLRSICGFEQNQAG
jgi:NAD(P)H-nitrite reductase large subunit